MSKFCYDKCYNIIQKAYNFFMLLSFRTKPKTEKEEITIDKLNCTYCKLCDLDDFRSETDLESNY